MTFNYSKKVAGVITEEVLTLAIMQDSSFCVIADSLKPALPEMVRWNVDLQTVRFTDPMTGSRYIYMTTPLMQRILIDFDHGIRPPVGTRVELPRRPVQILTRSIDSREKARERNRSYHRKTKKRPPIKINGDAPPLAVLAANGRGKGRRRVFGLRLTEAQYPGPSE
jgi:hypothetical protein